MGTDARWERRTMARHLFHTACGAVVFAFAALMVGATSADDAKLTSVLTISDHDADVWSASYNPDGSRILTKITDSRSLVE